MTNIWVARHTNKEGNPAHCRASVMSREGGSYSWIHSYQCTRKPIVCRMVDGKEYGFCKQHDPEAVNERNKARTEQWRRDAECRDLEHKRQNQEREAMKACKLAIEQIAAGHNDPRMLATETLRLFPSPLSQHHKA